MPTEAGLNAQGGWLQRFARAAFALGGKVEQGSIHKQSHQRETDD
jgi:hypothetical protein